MLRLSVHMFSRILYVINIKHKFSKNILAFSNIFFRANGAALKIMDFGETTRFTIWEQQLNHFPQL